MNTPKELNTGINYQEKYKQHSDAEIKEILLKRKAYQPEAAKAAIQEAIDRGIIHSDQDLFASEFNPIKDKSSKIFPQISKPEQKTKILSSIQRIFYILGILPVIYGGLNIYNHKLSTGIIFSTVGTIWIILNLKLKKSKGLVSIYFMLGILLLAFVYLMYSISTMKSATNMDLVITIAAFLISAYCLLFARSILKN